MTVFAKKELFEINAIPVVVLPVRGAVCVRGTKEEVSVIDDTVKKCQEGGTLLLFPEGTREQEESSFPSRAASSSSRRQQMWTSCLAASTTTPLMVR